MSDHKYSIRPDHVATYNAAKRLMSTYINAFDSAASGLESPCGNSLGTIVCTSAAVSVAPVVNVTRAAFYLPTASLGAGQAHLAYEGYSSAGVVLESRMFPIGPPTSNSDSVDLFSAAIKGSNRSANDFRSGTVSAGLVRGASRHPGSFTSSDLRSETIREESDSVVSLESSQSAIVCVRSPSMGGDLVPSRKFPGFKFVTESPSIFAWQGSQADTPTRFNAMSAAVNTDAFNLGSLPPNTYAVHVDFSATEAAPNITNNVVYSVNAFGAGGELLDTRTVRANSHSCQGNVTLTSESIPIRSISVKGISGTVFPFAFTNGRVNVSCDTRSGTTTSDGTAILLFEGLSGAAGVSLLVDVALNYASVINQSLAPYVQDNGMDDWVDNEAIKGALALCEDLPTALEMAQFHAMLRHLNGREAQQAVLQALDWKGAWESAKKIYGTVRNIANKATGFIEPLTGVLPYGKEISGVIEAGRAVGFIDPKGGRRPVAPQVIHGEKSLTFDDIMSRRAMDDNDGALMAYNYFAMDARNAELRAAIDGHHYGTSGFPVLKVRPSGMISDPNGSISYDATYEIRVTSAPDAESTYTPHPTSYGIVYVDSDLLDVSEGFLRSCAHELEARYKGYTDANLYFTAVGPEKIGGSSWNGAAIDALMGGGHTISAASGGVKDGLHLLLPVGGIDIKKAGDITVLAHDEVDIVASQG